MADWEHAHLGASSVPEQLSDLEIAFFFTLTADELAAVRGRRTPVSRLALALQIGLLKMTGRTPPAAPRAPKAVLTHVAQQLGVSAPDIASLRSLYRRRATRPAHAAAAREIIGFRAMNGGVLSQLVGYLRRESLSAPDTATLVRAAQVWLYVRKTVALSPWRLSEIAAEAQRWRQAQIAAAVARSVGPDMAACWADQLAEKIEGGLSRHEWLRAGPSRKSPAALKEQADRVAWLKSLGADRLDLDGAPQAFVQAHARAIELRRPNRLRVSPEPRRTVEIACFLRRQLARATDATAELFNASVTDFRRQANGRAQAAEAKAAPTYRRFALDVMALAGDAAVDDAEFRRRVAALGAPLTAAETPPSRTAAGRLEMARDAGRMADAIAMLAPLEMATSDDHPLTAALSVLRDTKRRGPDAVLPEGQDNPFGPAWDALIGHRDRALALGAWRAATALLLKRSLTNGTAALPRGDRFRAPEDHLIPTPLWARDKGRFIRDLGVSASAATTLAPIAAGVEAGLVALAEAAAAGDVQLDKGRFRMPRAGADPEEPGVASTRASLSRAIGEAQLPDVIVDVDAWTGFSAALLDRPARSARELVAAYAAILALGSDYEAADVGRMVDNVSAESAAMMMRGFEADGRLRAANDAVVAALQRLAVVRHWGPGVCASADMMSLDATRSLWSARIDPRRRRYGVGVYTHVLDRWGLIHDQPIVLGRRQAGAALEGVLRQENAAIERLAVDTHGVTHFSMALARLMGFDLCPRLAGVSKARLCVFRDTKVPEALEPYVSRSLSRRTISLGWDGLLRLAASAKGGWCSAVWALDRNGAAAAGDPVHRAGDALGKLLRTLFLCDYIAEASLRAEIDRLLNRGEAVHVLKRAIHGGSLAPKRGRTPEQLAAISGALTLLANIVIYWNARRMDEAIGAGLAKAAPEHLARIAPIGFAHINLRGRFFFNADPVLRAANGGAPASANG
jgi:TnpA family transposase